nr:hypothetical protein [Tanacetum cinerariifolium]
MPPPPTLDLRRTAFPPVPAPAPDPTIPIMPPPPPHPDSATAP